MLIYSTGKKDSNGDYPSGFGFSISEENGIVTIEWQADYVFDSKTMTVSEFNEKTRVR